MQSIIKSMNLSVREVASRLNKVQPGSKMASASLLFCVCPFHLTCFVYLLEALSLRSQ